MAPAHSSPPRRITRAALARFAYNNASASSSSSTAIATPPDIEDAIPSATSTRKRKHIAIHAASASSSSTTVVKAESTKKEEDEEEDDDNVKDEVKDEEEEEGEGESKVATAPRRARKPARRVVDPDTAEATTEPPSEWEEMYAAVRAMRFEPDGAAANAAVDTMGCERLAEPAASPRDRRFQTLVALMLSSQTKDTTNAVAMRRLQTELDAAEPGGTPGLTLANVLAVAPERLNELIWLVGFHNNKTRYLKQTAELLRDRWDGDIPDTFAGLTSLPGVGPKMAHLCLSAAWGRTEGIGVDVHVHRITNLWGWHTTRNPEDTRRALEAWLPRDRWHEINTLLVGLGQTVCLPVGRRCGDCDLGLRGLCRAADRAKVNQGRKAKKEGDVRVKVEVKAEVEIGELQDEVGETPRVVKKEEHSEDKEQVGAKEEDGRQKEETHEAIKKEESVAVTVVKNESVAVEDVLKDESAAVEDVVKDESMAVEDVLKNESVAVEDVVKSEDMTTDEDKMVVKGEEASDDEVKEEPESSRRVRRRRR
jgi:endonuclease III